MPLMSLWTVPWFLGEVRGYSKLYDNISDYGIPYAIFSSIWFLFFTDALIYWIHRGLHHPMLYHLHKPHHLWKVPTPFASHAFHHLDGYAQSLPYHLFVYLFPLHKFIYLGLFVFVNIWTISIHDQVYVAHDSFLNGAAHHTIHHLEFNYNYGQYFTLWDKIGNSYRVPEKQFQEIELKKRRKEGDAAVEPVHSVKEPNGSGLRQRA
jgi:lathosterol oxidase